MYTRGKVIAPGKLSDMFRANKFRPLEDECNINIKNPMNIEAKGRTTTPYLFIRCKFYSRPIDEYSRSM